MIDPVRNTFITLMYHLHDFIQDRHTEQEKSVDDWAVNMGVLWVGAFFYGNGKLQEDGRCILRWIILHARNLFGKPFPYISWPPHHL